MLHNVTRGTRSSESTATTFLELGISKTKARLRIGDLRPLGQFNASLAQVVERAPHGLGKGSHVVQCTWQAPTGSAGSTFYVVERLVTDYSATSKQEQTMVKITVT